jgi:hypothetical protein
MNTCTPCITSNHSSDPVPPTPFFNLFSCFTPAPHILFYPTSTYPVLGLLPARPPAYIILQHTSPHGYYPSCRGTPNILCPGAAYFYHRVYYCQHVLPPVPPTPRFSPLLPLHSHPPSSILPILLFSGSSPVQYIHSCFPSSPGYSRGGSARAHTIPVHITPRHILRHRTYYVAARAARPPGAPLGGPRPAWRRSRGRQGIYGGF